MIARRETGVIAYLEGNGSHTIAYRADILRALPILEENDVPYRSVNLIMYACLWT